VKHNYRRLVGACALTLSVLGLAAPVGAQAIWFVDSSAPAGGSGASWSEPFRYLQDALASAVAADEIHIGHGTYKPDQADNGGPTPGDRTATFALLGGVSLLGGYAGYGAADPNARDLDAYETILSGDLAGDDGVNFANTGDNSFHVLVGRETDASTMLDGLTIRGGTGSDSADPNYPNTGGGLFLVDASPTVLACTFRSNAALSAGGALFIAGGSPTLSTCNFSGNRANTGGAIECRDGAAPSVNDCQFSGNSAFDGGAVRHNGAGSPVFIRCKFNNNVANGNGGAVFLRNGSTAALSWCTFRGNSANTGGGIASRNASPLISGCEFSDNTALRSGGGVLSAQHSVATITDCAFLGNHAATGAGLYNSDDCNPTLTGCTFEQNIAAVEGGGLGSNGTNAFSLANCTFTGNAANWGGGMSNRGGAPTLTACTFADNSATYGGGYYSAASAVPFFDGGTLTGNSAYDGGGIFLEGGANPTLLTVTFQDNAATHAGGAFFSTGTCSPAILSCEFRDNRAAVQGGALCCLAGSTPALMSGRLVGNLSYGAGGAAHLDADASLDLINVVLIANTAGTVGGGVNLAGASRFSATNCLFNGNVAGSDDGGGALRGELVGVAVLYDCTITANRALLGGGVSTNGGDFRLFNSILWGNTNHCGASEAAQLFTGGAPAEVHYCDLQGWSGYFGGVGNFGRDPQFVAPAGPDGVAGTEDDDLRLGPASPCIDAGDNGAVPADIFDLNRNGDTSEPLPFDLAGQTRLVDDPDVPDTGAGTPPLVDIGAWEFQLPARLGDLNCDGLVNFDDITPFVLAVTDPNAYAALYPACPLGLADCNRDGQVDESDIDAFVALLAE
jgi:predicted outer membrane repeat protein